jgi:L-malate glycosyltransferase
MIPKETLPRYPVKVLHTLQAIGHGGVEQRRLSLAMLLPTRKFSQYLACSRVIGGFDQKFISSGTEVFVLGELANPFNLAYYRRLIDVVRNVKPLIIHGAVFEGVISAVVGGIFGRVPVIIVEETSDPINRSWRGHLLFKFLSRFADAVVATSPTVYQYLTEKIRLPKAKVRLIHNGARRPPEVPAETVRHLRLKYNIPENVMAIGSVGRLFNNVKRFSDLIDAIAILATKPEFDNVVLLIVGDGPDKGMLQERARNAGVESKVIFAGHQTDVNPFLAMMDVFALVSSTESFGMAVVEAMFHKLPVVGSSIGGIKDIIRDGETGIAVPAYAPEAISVAIRTLFKDKTLRLRMGENGFARASSEYTAERYARNIEAFYDEMIEKKIK